MQSYLYALTLMSVLSNISYADDCLEWFRKSKIEPNSKTCEILCSSLPVDMGTFDCTQNCTQYCKPQKNKCEDTFWHKRIKLGRPLNWPNLSEKDKEWIESEKTDLIVALQKLPKIFQTIKFQGFYRMSLPQLENLGTKATTSGNSIVLYNKAFWGKTPVERIVSHELVHILTENEWHQTIQGYAKFMGWNNNKVRPGKFVTSDGEESVEEDFANNIEYFLFDPETLMKVTPKAHDWIKRNFGEKFKVNEGCQDEKTK